MTAQTIAICSGCITALTYDDEPEYTLAIRRYCSANNVTLGDARQLAGELLPGTTCPTCGRNNEFVHLWHATVSPANVVTL